MPKNDEGNIRWECNYFDPNARIKQHRTVKLDALKTSKDESERWHHSQPRSSVNFIEFAQFSACDNFSWETWERQAGRQAERQGGQGLGKQTRHPTKGNKKEDKLGDNLGDKLGDKGDKDLGKAGTPSNKGKQVTRRKTNSYTSWETSETRTREGGQTIQQRETRRETMGDKGEGGHTSQQRETRRETSWETSWKTSWETRETRPREGGHTIQETETGMETSWERSW